MLHMEIIQERLEREFNQTVITTVPNVSFKAYTTREPEVAITVNNPTEMPDPSRLDRIEEPFIRAQIITLPDYIGTVSYTHLNTYTKRTFHITEKAQGFPVPFYLLLT